MSLDSGVVIEIDSPSAFDCSVSSGLSSPSPQPTPGWVTRKAHMDLLPLHIAYIPLVQGLQPRSHPLSSSALCSPGCGGQIWEDQKDPSQGKTWQISYHSEQPTRITFPVLLLHPSGTVWRLTSATISYIPHPLSENTLCKSSSGWLPLPVWGTYSQSSAKTRTEHYHFNICIYIKQLWSC